MTWQNWRGMAATTSLKKRDSTRRATKMKMSQRNSSLARMLSEKSCKSYQWRSPRPSPLFPSQNIIHICEIIFDQNWQESILCTQNRAFKSGFVILYHSIVLYSKLLALTWLLILVSYQRGEPRMTSFLRFGVNGIISWLWSLGWVRL